MPKNKKPFEIHSIHGIKTVFYPLHDLPAVMVQLSIRAGSWYETESEAGAFHLLEHLTNQNTVGFPNILALEEFKEEYGLTSNASTGGPRINYWVKGPNYSLKQAVHLLNQVVFQPVLVKDRLPKEISIITQEFKDYWDKPNVRFGEKIDELIFGENHPYTKDALGIPEKLQKLTIEQIKKLHLSYYQTENMIMTVTGDFEIDDAKKILDQTITPLAEQSKPEVHIGRVTPQFKTLIHEDEVKQQTLVLLWPVKGLEELSMKDRITLHLLSYLIGGSARSRLFVHLREEKGLVYRSGSTRRILPKGGYFEAWCSTDDEKTKEALETMRKTIYEFVNSPISEQLLNRAKRFLKARTLIALDSLDSISDDITGSMFWEDRVILPAENIRITETITAKDLYKIGSHYLKPEAEHTAIMKRKN